MKGESSFVWMRFKPLGALANVLGDIQPVTLVIMYSMIRKLQMGR